MSSVELAMPIVQSDWPPEVQIILSALEAARSPLGRRPDRRALKRRSYRVRAHLYLFSDPHDAPPWVLYTSDVSARGLGFICRGRLPLGYGGTLKIALPSGRPSSIGCTLLRCRETANGWYDGALYFN